MSILTPQDQELLRRHPLTAPVIDTVRWTIRSYWNHRSKERNRSKLTDAEIFRRMLEELRFEKASRKKKAFVRSWLQSPACGLRHFTLALVFAEFDLDPYSMPYAFNGLIQEELDRPGFPGIIIDGDRSLLTLASISTLPRVLLSVFLREYQTTTGSNYTLLKKRQRAARRRSKPGDCQTDPIEQESNYQTAMATLRPILDEVCGHGFGSCHFRWRMQQMLLEEFFSIQWFPASDMNPGWKFD